MQFESRGRNVHTPGGPLVGSFQHMLWPRRRASEAAILVSRTFAFVFSWYKVIIAISLCFSSGALQYTVHTSIIAAKIVSLNFFFELQYFGPDLKLAWTKTAISIRSLQNADCRVQTGYKMQTRYKMQTENLYCFFVWTWQHVILQLTERHAIAFPRSSFTIICTNVEYPLPFLDHNRS